MYQALLDKKTLVLGCGNPLLGDDGFGPAVIRQLEKTYPLPDHIGVLDAGTSVRDLLFDLLVSEPRQRTIIVIDAVDHQDRSPGELFEIDIARIPANKIADYSIHQFPSTNMLKELNETGLVDIHFHAVQIDSIPEVVQPGLSSPVEKAVSRMCRKLCRLLDDKEKESVRKGSCDEEPVPC